eukprot:7069284-Pyramimonas_sp.AAC.1
MCSTCTHVPGIRRLQTYWTSSVLIGGDARVGTKQIGPPMFKYALARIGEEEDNFDAPSSTPKPDAEKGPVTREELLALRSVGVNGF